MVLWVKNKSQAIILCMCNWKRSNPTARPSARVTMKTASQRFST